MLLNQKPDPRRSDQQLAIVGELPLQVPAAIISWTNYVCKQLPGHKLQSKQGGASGTVYSVQQKGSIVNWQICLLGQGSTLDWGEHRLGGTSSYSRVLWDCRMWESDIPQCVPCLSSKRVEKPWTSLREGGIPFLNTHLTQPTLHL